MFKKLVENIKNNSKYRKLSKLAMKFTLPGFDGVPVLSVLQFIIKEVKNDLIPTRARSIAYSFFIAFFPGIIFLLTLLPYIPLDNFETELINLINQFIPDNVVNSFILTTMDDLINKPRSGLLSFGILLTIYFSSQGVVSIIMSFNKTYSIYVKRNFFSMQWAALKLTAILFLLFITSVTLLIGGDWMINIFLNYVNIKSFWVNFLLNGIRYSIIILLFFLSISFIYYYGPSTKKKWRFVSVGSTFATISSIITSLIFQNYISGFAKYNTVYGIFGSIILFLTWLYANAFVLLIGFELNNAIYYQSSLLNQDDDNLIA